MADPDRDSDRTPFAPEDRSADGQRARIERHVMRLAAEIGPRNLYHYDALQEAAAYIEHALAEAGHAPVRQSYETRGKSFSNIVAEVPGRARKDEIVVVGAHYDTHKDSPGANDNERSADDIVLVAYNQGTLVGDTDAEHISPIGAYDPERRRALILDTDRMWYVPYWSSDEKLLESMLYPAADDPERGGFVRVRVRPGGPVSAAAGDVSPEPTHFSWPTTLKR